MEFSSSILRPFVRGVHLSSFLFHPSRVLPGSRTAASFAGGRSQTLSGFNDASCPEMARVVVGRKCDTYVCQRTYTRRVIGTTDKLAYLLRATPTPSCINSPATTLAITPETILYRVLSPRTRTAFISAEFQQNDLPVYLTEFSSNFKSYIEA